ncbi:mitochondrial ubiquitin ligase activator of nfkb 1-A-like [Branchiostoma floridae]|uniref:RING-type E3 ubiquitin transferase n=1 Tax=Branchiostoma floridae TaxID=7739 RepID=A0A9J7LXL8_BRAFL|nr:mitochondrial ubiquitin ligase activator of nfkb 1-A-like [Branchiostoma floridae]
MEHLSTLWSAVDKPDLVWLGVGTACTSLFAYLWGRGRRTRDTIKHAMFIDANIHDVVAGTPNQTIPYAVIEGLVEPVGKPLQSQLGVEGVIQELLMEEHRRVWNKVSRIWYDTSRTIRRVTNRIPFSLACKGGKVRVLEPTQAAMLSLDVIYDKFEPEDSTMGKRVVDWMSGEAIKGYQETEKMLKVGTQLFGYGELSLEEGQVVLRNPSNNASYFITNLSPSELAKQYQTKVTMLKAFTILFGVGTLIALCAFAAKWYRRYRENQEFFAQTEQVRAARRRPDGEPPEELDEEHACVVCQANAREVIILDCGHICCCADCADMLQPRKCPICRRHIARILPVYNP